MPSPSSPFDTPHTARAVLITGCEGFAGSHLAEYLLADYPHLTIHGTRRPKASLDNIAHIQGRLHLHDADVTDETSVHQLLDSIRPEVIFHLAAQSYVRTSWESPQATLTTNILGTVNVLESLRQLKSSRYDPIVVIPGSSEEYGHSPAGTAPITEDYPLKPASPYAVSKMGQEFLGFQYWKTYGLKAMRLRVFNHTGPRRPTAFGDSNVAHTIALIEAGLAEPMLTYRDLTATRDFTDVRDIARAYLLAAQSCEPGQVYNVCSGHGITIRQIYETLLAQAQVAHIALVPDPAGPRPTDGGIIVGDNSRFCTQTGWRPRISFLRQTLPDMLNFWRDAIATRTTHETVHSHSSLQR